VHAGGRHRDLALADLMTAEAVVEEVPPQLARWDYQALYAGTSKADLAFALELATTPAEVDQAAHIGLVMFDVAGTMRPFDEHGRTWPSLHHCVMRARHRVDGFAPQARATSERLNALSEEARDRAARQRAADRRERDARIERIGFTNAYPPAR